eukprot:jgi/Mesen1/4554/ME000232S03811
MAAARFFALALVAALAVVSIPACAAKAPARESILVEILGSKFTTFVSLLEHADLLDVLEKELVDLDGVTIFAPTDYYLLEKVPSSLLTFLKQPMNSALLQKILLFHFLPHKISEQEWGATYQSLEGSELSVSIEDGLYMAGGSRIKELDALSATDGVVHGLSGLLVPSDLKAMLRRFKTQSSSSVLPIEEPERRILIDSVTAASAPAPAPSAAPTPSSAPAPAPTSDLQLTLDALRAAGDYNVFLDLLKLSGLEAELANIDQPVTLLVPDDAAFAQLPQSINSQLTDSNKDDLRQFLLHHIIVGQFSTDQLTSIATTGKAVQGQVTTLNGDTIPVTTSNGVLYLGDPPVAINSPNLLESDQNGLAIQGIDGVLVPPGLFLTPAGAPALAPTPAGSPPKSSGLRHMMDSRFVIAAAVAVGALLL